MCCCNCSKLQQNGRFNGMASRARSGATTEEGASVFSKSSDDKENMTELCKTGGGKQSKQEVAEDQTNGHENEEIEGQVSKRALRKRWVLSYKEPSVMSKIRRYPSLPLHTMFWCTDVDDSYRYDTLLPQWKL